MAEDNNYASISSIARFDDSAMTHLKDFDTVHSLPNIVKVKSGKYRNIGELDHELFLHSIKTVKKILAEAVKIKDRGKSATAVTCEQKFAFPITYEGWFELLSADGKTLRPIQGVEELSQILPNKCLVRDNIRAYIPSVDGELSQDNVRFITPGETLEIGEEFIVKLAHGKSTVSKNLLQCVDGQGETVYLPLDAKGGLFSPIAGPKNISGVHQIRVIIEKFRLPLMVRLVHGVTPGRLDKNQFTGVFRLLSTYDGDTAFALPTRKGARMVPISLRENLILSPSRNLQSLTLHDAFDSLHSRCSEQILSYLDSIHVLVDLPAEAVEKRNAEILKRSMAPYPGSRAPAEEPRPITAEDIMMDEIDDIYAYVREGGLPPPSRHIPMHLLNKAPKDESKRKETESKSINRIPSRELFITEDTTWPELKKEIFDRATPQATGGADPKEYHQEVEEEKRNHNDPLPSTSNEYQADVETPETPAFTSPKTYTDDWVEPIYDEIDKYIKRMKEGGVGDLTQQTTDQPVQKKGIRGLFSRKQSNANKTKTEAVSASGKAVFVTPETDVERENIIKQWNDVNKLNKKGKAPAVPPPEENIEPEPEVQLPQQVLLKDSGKPVKPEDTPYEKLPPKSEPHKKSHFDDIKNLAIGIPSSIRYLTEMYFDNRPKLPKMGGKHTLLAKSGAEQSQVSKKEVEPKGNSHEEERKNSHNKKVDLKSRDHNKKVDLKTGDHNKKADLKTGDHNKKVDLKTSDQRQPKSDDITKKAKSKASSRNKNGNQATSNVNNVKVEPNVGSNTNIAEPRSSNKSKEPKHTNASGSKSSPPESRQPKTKPKNPDKSKVKKSAKPPKDRPALHRSEKQLVASEVKSNPITVPSTSLENTYRPPAKSADDMRFQLLSPNNKNVIMTSSIDINKPNSIPGNTHFVQPSSPGLSAKIIVGLPSVDTRVSNNRSVIPVGSIGNSSSQVASNVASNVSRSQPGTHTAMISLSDGNPTEPSRYVAYTNIAAAKETKKPQGNHVHNLHL